MVTKDKDYATKALRARLVAAGVDPQKFDVHAHVDRKLSQRENFINLTQMTGSGKRKEYDPSLSRQTPKKALDEWRQIGRTHKEVDKKLKAKLPGVRYVKHPGAKPTKYTERRKNRSDRPSGWI
jgi:hypothetical protein